MQHIYNTNDMIEQLVAIQAESTLGVSDEVLRRALHALVELAKSEQLLQMRRDVAAAMGEPKRQDW